MDMAMGHEQPGVAEIRKLSLTLLLDDEFEGGEFQINGSNAHEPIVVPLHKGRAVLFPSFMIHRVTPITKGKRRSIVVWVVGPKFQ
jgi:PKHD-type hydroxylase